MHTHLAMIYRHVGRSDVDFLSTILMRFDVFLDFVTLTHFQAICLHFCGQATKGQTVIDNIYICKRKALISSDSQFQNISYDYQYLLKKYPPV